MNDQSDSAQTTISEHHELTTVGRYLVLIAAFLGWMFAGLEMSNFNLTTGPMVHEFLGDTLAEHPLKAATGKWFGWFICAFLMGAACGGLLFGWLGDCIGRSRTMGLSILWFSLGMGSCYFANSLEQLLVLRFIASFGIGGMWPNGVALASEAWSNASRPLLAGLIGTAANVGIALMGYIGELRDVAVGDWRWVMIVSASPAILALFVFLFVPESPRWLDFQKRKQEGDGEEDDAPAQSSIARVFRPPYLTLTIIGIFLGTIPLLGGWGTNNWLIRWAGEVGMESGDMKLKAMTQRIGSTGAAIGSLLGGWLASFFGRRATYFAISLGALASSGYIFWFLTPEHRSQFLQWVFILRLISTVYFGWLPLYLPELFPTEIRSTGAGVTFNFGRILSTLGVLGTSALVGVFAGDYAQVGRITHLIYALGMLVILFAPNTSKNKLDT